MIVTNRIYSRHDWLEQVGRTRRDDASGGDTMAALSVINRIPPNNFWHKTLTFLLLFFYITLLLTQSTRI